jgi:iron complex transport system ATP-binding protein
VSAIELRDVSVAYGEVEILRDVSLEVGRGEWAAVIGPNGAGKTTLLRAVAGLVGWTGTIELGGADGRTLGRRERASRLALVPQSPVLPPEMTVGEYVLLGRTPHLGYLASESRHDRAAAAAAIRRLELEPFAERALTTLSGGEAQRAVLARALAQEAEIVLLDEPTSALDIGRQQRVLDLVDVLRREDGLTVLAAMHDLTLAGQYAARLFLLDGGMLVAAGTPAEILRADLLADHYGAAVRVVADGGDVFVLPARRVREETLCGR